MSSSATLNTLNTFNLEVIKDAYARLHTRAYTHNILKFVKQKCKILVSDGGEMF